MPRTCVYILETIMQISRRSLLLLPVAGAAARAQSAATNTDATPLFRTSVSLVKVDAQLTTRDGQDIGNLQASDFIVYDENEPQKIAHFGRESEPIDVLLVLDVSASMRKSLGEMAAKASEALRQLRRGDRVGLLLFATRSDMVQPLTEEFHSVPEKITNSIYKESLGQATLVNEALVAAARSLRAARGAGRRTIVVATDNEVSRDRVSDAQVVRELQAADAVLNAIIVGDPDAKPREAAPFQNPSSAPPDMFRFAKATGGDVITSEDPAAALSRVVRRATTRYSLQYAAPGGKPGSLRKIRVELSPEARRRYPDVAVQARSGYEVTE